MREKATTEVGYVNVNRQRVVRRTTLAGSIPGQRIYVLRCERCGFEYGANGCDIHERKCPGHDHTAARGLEFGDR